MTLIPHEIYGLIILLLGIHFSCSKFASKWTIDMNLKIQAKINNRNEIMFIIPVN
jgi:hypothetical protein